MIMKLLMLVFVIVVVTLRIWVTMVQKDIWGISLKQFICTVPFLLLSDTLGSRIIGTLAAGPSIESTRLYGAVIASSIMIWIAAVICRIPIDKLYGASAIGTWITVAMFKIRCLISGCCYGKTLQFGNIAFQIPSQIIEIVGALLLFIWFFKLGQKLNGSTVMYPLTLIWYGIYRYAADWMRGGEEELKPILLWMPAGRVFSLLILISGLIALCIVLKKKGTFSIKNVLHTIVGKEEQI